jgi:hypothetical protein
LDEEIINFCLNFQKNHKLLFELNHTKSRPSVAKVFEDGRREGLGTTWTKQKLELQ